MTQRKLAERAGVTPNTVSELERGREPSLAVLFDVCGVLDLDPAELVGLAFGTGKPTPSAKVQQHATQQRADLSDAIALKLAETNQHVTRWSELLGYMRAVHDMMQSVTASQGKVIEQTEPLVRLQQEIAGRHLPDDLQRQIREHLVQSAQAEKSPEDRKAQ